MKSPIVVETLEADSATSHGKLVLLYLKEGEFLWQMSFYEDFEKEVTEITRIIDRKLLDGISNKFLHALVDLLTNQSSWVVLAQPLHKK